MRIQLSGLTPIPQKVESGFLGMLGQNPINKPGSGTFVQDIQDVLRKQKQDEQKQFDAEYRNCKQEAAGMSLVAEDMIDKLQEIRKIYKKNPREGLKAFKSYIYSIQMKILMRIRDFAKQNIGRSKYKPYHIENIENEDKFVTYVLDNDGNMLAQCVYGGPNKVQAEKLFNTDVNGANSVEVELTPTGKLFGHIQVNKDGKKQGRINVSSDKLNFDLPSIKSTKKK